MRNEACYTCREEADRTLPAVVHIEAQTVTKAFQSEAALKAGTLFPELFKPMNGEYPTRWSSQPDEAQAQAFAIWELRLYLDTHPDDEEAIALLERLVEDADCVTYATAFLRDHCGCGTENRTWSWVNEMWPWEKPGCVKNMGKAGAKRQACAVKQYAEPVCEAVKTNACAALMRQQTEDRCSPDCCAEYETYVQVCNEADRNVREKTDEPVCAMEKQWAYEAPAVVQCEQVRMSACTLPIDDSAMKRRSRC